MVKDRSSAFIHIGNSPIFDGSNIHNELYNINDAILPATVGWFATVARLALESSPDFTLGHGLAA
jgi:hypothetical protein